MSCIDKRGRLLSLGKVILKSLKKSGPMSAEELSKASGVTEMSTIESGLKELTDIGYIAESEGKYKISEKGEKMLSKFLSPF